MLLRINWQEYANVQKFDRFKLDLDNLSEVFGDATPDHVEQFQWPIFKYIILSEVLASFDVIQLFHV